MFKYYFFLRHYDNLTTMKEDYNEEKMRIAFSNVKKDILDLKNEIKSIKTELLKIKEILNVKNNGSKGNKGVLTTTLRQPYDNLTTTNPINYEKINKNLEILDFDLKQFVLSLTDKEFLIFYTIYQQEEELRRPITYEEISKKLKISQSYLRDCIRELILKESPIIKQKSGSKMFLSITKEFRFLKIGSKIMDFRRSFGNQTHLSEDFNI